VLEQRALLASSITSQSLHQPTCRWHGVSFGPATYQGRDAGVSGQTYYQTSYYRQLYSILKAATNTIL